MVFMAVAYELGGNGRAAKPTHLFTLLAGRRIISRVLGRAAARRLFSVLSRGVFISPVFADFPGRAAHPALIVAELEAALRQDEFSGLWAWISEHRQ